MAVITGGQVLAGGRVVDGSGGYSPLTSAGLPDGTTFAGIAAPGARLIRTDTGAYYTNTGTQAAPVWTIGT